MTDFPILSRRINGKRLVYLDSAATSQKPVTVIKTICDYYERSNSNVHRGVHTLGDESTEIYENARKRVAGFIGANASSEVIFTKNATDSLNIVAMGWGLKNLQKGDVILTTVAEHNSSVLPWVMVVERTGAVIDYLEMEEDGTLSLEEVKKKLNSNVKVLALSHASNVLGSIFPVKEICSLAKERNILTVVDGSQAVPHLPVNVKSLGCDFYAFSGHKMLGPMGIGVLWGSKDRLTTLSPSRLGGGTVLDVSRYSYELQQVPECFEPGTPDVAGAAGLSAAIDYLEDYGMEKVREHEIELTKYALENLKHVQGIHIIGPMDAEKRTGLISFTLDDIHSHDLAALLDSEGIAVRSGMHCAMNLHHTMHIPSSTRASFYIYNNKEDIDALIFGIERAQKILGK